jgi:hypothetical protein
MILYLEEHHFSPESRVSETQVLTTSSSQKRKHREKIKREYGIKDMLS